MMAGTLGTVGAIAATTGLGIGGAYAFMSQANNSLNFLEWEWKEPGRQLILCVMEHYYIYTFYY